MNKLHQALEAALTKLKAEIEKEPMNAERVAVLTTAVSTLSSVPNRLS